MLRKIIKNSGLNDSEEKLVNLADDAFLGLWTYANVFSDEGFSKNKSGKEICDLLVVFDNHIIIFSDKNITFNTEKTTDVAWKRWLRKSVLESATQLYGAEQFMRLYPNRIFVDVKCTTPFPVEIKNDFQFHLISVTNNISEHAKKYYDSFAVGSSATLVNTFIYNPDEMLEHPFCVGDVDKNKTFIHILDEVSLGILLTGLNTVTDFINYLVEKESVIRSGKLVLSHGEEDTLAVYLLNNNEIIPSNLLKDDQVACLPENEWNVYLSSLEFKYNAAMKKGSSLWDEMIQNFSKCILSGDVGDFKEYGFLTHELALRELAKESRKSRYYLSKNLQDKFEQTIQNKRTSRIVESIDEKGKYYLFLFIPNDRLNDYANYRMLRKYYADAYIKVAFYKYAYINKLIVIATETKNPYGYSEDIIYVNRVLTDTPESRNEAKRLIKEEQILSDFLPTQIKSDPDTLQSRIYQKVGRNDLCPCHSGLKFKKCHGK